MKKINRLLLVILLCVFTYSCEDEDICDCGYVTYGGEDRYGYWLEVENECSGNRDIFYFDYSTWVNYSDGEYICFCDESW